VSGLKLFMAIFFGADDVVPWNSKIEFDKYFAQHGVVLLHVSPVPVS
jgi:hypothetical protein